MDVNQLKGRKAALLDEAKKINAELESGDFEGDRKAAEQRADTLVHAADAINSEIESKLADEQDAITRARPVDAVYGTRSGGGRKVWAAKGSTPMGFAQAMAVPAANGNYAGFGDFLNSLRNQREGRAHDERLGYFAAQSGGSNPAGGFLVPDLLQQEVVQTVDSDEVWLDRVDRYMMPDGFGAAAWPVLADRDESGGDKGGVSLTRRGENITLTESSMTLEQFELKLTSAATIIKVSNELLTDAMPGSVDSLIRNTFSRLVRQRMAVDLLQGTGVGEPAGVIDAASTYTVAAEGAQSPDTIVGDNLLKMRERIRPGSLNRAVWLAHPDTYRQLVDAHTTLTNDDVPLFQPGRGIDAPDALLGRPIYFTDACPRLGEKGDIVLGDFSAYQYSMKPLLVDLSTHVSFEQHETAFKLLVRDDGRPKYGSTHKGLSGFETAEFVTLAERA